MFIWGKATLPQFTGRLERIEENILKVQKGSKAHVWNLMTRKTHAWQLCGQGR